MGVLPRSTLCLGFSFANVSLSADDATEHVHRPLLLFRYASLIPFERGVGWPAGVEPI